VQALLGQFDLLTLLGRFTPSLLATLGMGLPVSLGRGSIVLSQGGQVVSLTVALLLAGFALGSCYLFAVAHAVRGTRRPPLAVAADGLGVFGRLLGLVAYAVAALAVVVLVLALADWISPGLMQVGLAMLFVGALWVAFYLYFAVDAVVVGGLRAAAAMRASLLLFRLDFGSAAMVVVLVTLIRMGLPILWRGLVANPAGLVGASIANAYIGTALAAATMLFFVQQWERARQALPASPMRVRR
jgi:hypothetical protein